MPGSRLIAWLTKARRCLGLVAAMLPVAGCWSLDPNVSTTAVPKARSFSIKGVMNYGESVALPSDARVILQVREGMGNNWPVVVEYQWDLRGLQFPLPLEVVVPRSALTQDRFCFMRAAIMVDGMVVFVSPVAEIALARGHIDIGILSLLIATPGAFTTSLTRAFERRSSLVPAFRPA